jgi:hypothetical protein
VDDPRQADEREVGDDEARLDMLKDKVRILVESPLFFTGSLFEHDLIAQQARIL